LKPKYVIVVPDGAADNPIEEFGGRTVFEIAEIPNIHQISKTGKLGLCQTVPAALQPGSDVAMMSVLGYDPEQCYTGRAPIEAEAQGINVGPDDWVFRCNLVTIANGKMLDHSAGHISTEEGKEFVDELNRNFGNDKVRFYAGVGYRHLLVVSGYDFTDLELQPPHDNIGINVLDIYPKGKNAGILIELIERSKELFNRFTGNLKRKKQGKREVSSIWLWGHGKKAKMEQFENKYGIKGSAITAVDLVKGLAKLVGFEYIKVDGATGYFDTNYAGKGHSAIEALKRFDLVLVHVEATDEAGHAGNALVKKESLEKIDKYIVGPVLAELQKKEEWRILVMPDHPTPVKTRAHSGEPVPFAIAGAYLSEGSNLEFNERNAHRTGIFLSNGSELMRMFLQK